MKRVLPAEKTILEALRDLVPGASNRTLRQLLERGRVRLDGVTVRSASSRIPAGGAVEILARGDSRSLALGLEIVYEDEDILLVEKPAGLLTVATVHEKERTAYSLLRQYLRRRHRGTKPFIVHRLDKLASGVLVFAKNEAAQARLKEQFGRHDVRRKYWAVVEGRVARERGTVRSRLAENQARRMHSTEDPSEGKEAVTHYRVLRRFPGLTSLEVTLETGRKNQIRVHLAELGHPIAGDRSYGGTKNPLGRLGLHAFLLGFVHPTRGVPVMHQTPVPPEFARFLPSSPTP